MKLKFVLLILCTFLICVCCIRNKDKNKNILDGHNLQIDLYTNNSCSKGCPAKNGRRELKAPPGAPGQKGPSVECKKICDVTRKATTLTTTITVTEAINPTSVSDFIMNVPITQTASIRNYNKLNSEEKLIKNTNKPTPQIIDKKIPAEDNAIFEIVKEKVDNMLSSSDPKNDRKEAKPITNDQPILYDSKS